MLKYSEGIGCKEKGQQQQYLKNYVKKQIYLTMGSIIKVKIYNHTRTWLSQLQLASAIPLGVIATPVTRFS